MLQTSDKRNIVSFMLCLHPVSVHALHNGDLHAVSLYAIYV